jgi:uncharacterized membrane protein HdeD (DUF308 family)
VVGVVRENSGELRASWYWFVILGAALMLLGLTALSYSVLTTLVTARVFSFFLPVSFEQVSFFRLRRHQGG